MLCLQHTPERQDVFTFVFHALRDSEVSFTLMLISEINLGSEERDENEKLLIILKLFFFSKMILKSVKK